MIFGSLANPNEDSLHAELTRLLADTTADVWSETDRNTYINRAYRELNQRVKPVRMPSQVTQPALAAGMTLPTDFMELAAGGLSWAFNNDTTTRYRLQRRGISELDELANGWQSVDYPSGTPRYYYLESYSGSTPTVVLVPKPQTAGIIMLEYYPKITQLTNSASEPWGGKYEEWHHAIAARAEVYARQQEQDREMEQLAERRAAILEMELRKAISDLGPPRSNVVHGNPYRKGFRLGRG
jgi:hypothetical protein